MKALSDARKRAPFLSKWKHFPQEITGGDWEVKWIAQREWETFLKQFSVTRIGYDEVDIKTIMDWYDRERAPFSKKKPNEFPDAFVIAALAAFAEKHGCIAVVAQDPDFQAACQHYSSLLYFPTLPALTEVLLLDDAANTGIKTAMDDGSEIIEKAIADYIEGVDCHHSNGTYSIEELEIESVTVTAINIVAIGNQECTVTYVGDVLCRARLSWDVEPGDEHGPQTALDRVRDEIEVTGSAKVVLNPDRSAVVEVAYTDLDGDSLEIDREPSHDDYY